ncbi:hypothetical protein [Vibrio superstes]|uniref:Beta/gamma crystallin 'Greek key' domain-containing protein n=1 Tax=Vibrio superstes NBRC 103154 TaxID=1219062 RepID=A0A511QV12_9VIBR|nr:hypothetical protein [Vibrio superstes]GEM81208.1 hypothetical protein VSU01S_34530 [Vibrio superstes NBRC 103154]
MKQFKNLLKGIALLVVVLSGFNAQASEGPIHAKDSEVSAVKTINKPYFDAFKGSVEDNWVYQLSNNNQLQAHCYLSKNESFAIGEKTNYTNIQMECIQIGQSTRVFWPTRWVEHCQSVGKPYNQCIMEEIKI